MHPQLDLSFYKFRPLFVGLSTIAFVVLISALITTVGSNTILDSKNHSSASILDTSAPADSPDAVTDIISNMSDATKQAMLTAGTTFYGACKSLTSASARTGDATAHAGAVVGGHIWGGVAFVGHGTASGITTTFHAVATATMFTVHLPGKAVSSVVHVQNVSALIRPADNKKPAPVINSETTAAVLASFNAQQRQEIIQLQAAQLAANQKLDGSVVAGDSNHGGYPAKWDAPVRQDSLVDSWGMYNRECVSYAAWKVYQTFGSMPYWGGVGNANQWVRDARNAGIPTGSTPQVHSVAISMYGYYGHAMWVEAVKGNMIYVSQYNYDLHGHYSEMWVNGSAFTYIYFK